MSTTRLWGRADNGDEVRHAQGDPSEEYVCLFWGEIGGNGWTEGSEFEGALPVQFI